jgi:hypothetical protein
MSPAERLDVVRKAAALAPHTPSMRSLDAEQLRRVERNLRSLERPPPLLSAPPPRPNPKLVAQLLTEAYLTEAWAADQKPSRAALVPVPRPNPAPDPLQPQFDAWVRTLPGRLSLDDELTFREEHGISRGRFRLLRGICRVAWLHRRGPKR